MSENPDIAKKQGSSKPKKKENLKQRAYLNSVTSIIDYGARVLTTFVVTPFLISGLGSTLFGVWKTLGQFASYTSMADIKVTEVLKWAVAKDRDSTSGDELRNYFTATFVLVMLLLPILLIVGAILVWFSPVITGVDENYVDVVRITTSLLVLSLVVSKVFGIFESILRGMNIGFKRMGFRATIFLIGGGLQILAIVIGYGIITLALIQLFIALTIGITIYIIVKNNVHWFGWGEFSFKKSLSFLHTSGWFMGIAITKMVISNSDKILLSYLAGPAVVTKYVITHYLIKSVRGVISNVIHGVLPGMGKLYGNEEFKKLFKVRNDAMLINWIIVSCVGCVVLLLNQSFTTIWVGSGEFAGQLENLLILIIVVQYLFTKIDGSIILTTMDVRQKLIIGVISSLVIVSISFLLIEDFGIIGLCIAIVIGNLIMNISYPYILYKKTGEEYPVYKFSVRLLIVTLALWTVAYFGGSMYLLESWLALVLVAIIIMVITLWVMYWLGIRKEHREVLKYYTHKINFFSTQN